jgi:RNA polymerase sigma-70 factor (ECF subfamily)
MEDWSDVDLLTALTDGSQEAFERFCTRSLPTLSRVLAKYCRAFGLSQDLVDDFVQETLLRAVIYLRNHKKIPDSARRSLLSWILTIARNLVVDWVRSRKHVRTIDKEKLDELATAADHLIVPDEAPLDKDQFGQWTVLSSLPADEADRVFTAIESLSSSDREILEHILLREHTAEEVATQLGISTGAAYKRYERALQRLHEHLRPPA